jgi:hypothetical protein
MSELQLQCIVERFDRPDSRTPMSSSVSKNGAGLAGSSCNCSDGWWAADPLGRPLSQFDTEADAVSGIILADGSAV